MIIGAGNIRIKVCGNKSPVNIAAVADLNPDMLGFIFYDQSKRCADPATISPVMKAMKNVHKTGVFINAPQSEIMDVVHQLGLDSVQLHGDEDPCFCAELQEKTTVIKTLDGTGKNLPYLVNLFANTVDYYLIDNKGKNYGGTGVKFEHEILKNINFPHPFIVAGGINPGDVELVKRLKNIPGFFGIDINSGFETEPGIKNIESIKTFIQQLQ
ncbi:MAG TPA: phosphoribosylanthranilate isomerase [Flavobacteriales bacterium]|nr:phosphoribosylanthranilate isomerase [Flavobacteriales bacterium]